jgi:hypothetical protein
MTLMDKGDGIEENILLNESFTFYTSTQLYRHPILPVIKGSPDIDGGFGGFCDGLLYSLDAVSFEGAPPHSIHGLAIDFPCLRLHSA